MGAEIRLPASIQRHVGAVDEGAERLPSLNRLGLRVASKTIDSRDNVGPSALCAALGGFAQTRRSRLLQHLHNRLLRGVLAERAVPEIVARHAELAVSLEDHADLPL